MPLHPTPTAQAFPLLLLAVTLNSIYPVLVPALGLSAHPLFYVSLWKAGMATGLLITIPLLHRPTAANPRLWLASLATLRRLPFWLTCLSHTDILFLTLAANHIPIPIAVITIQLSPLLFIATLWFSHRTHPHYNRPRPTLIPLSLLALLGVALAILSDQPTPGTALPWHSLIGIALSLAALAVGAGNALNIRIARDISRQLGPAAPPLLPSLATALLSLLILSPTLMALSATTEPTGNLHTSLTIYALGILIPTAAGVAWRLANLITADLSINILNNLTPVMAITWLAIAGLDGVAHPKLLFLGAALVTFANAALFITRDTSSPITGPRPR